MTAKIGSFGRIREFEDFLGNYVTADPTTTFSSLGKLGTISVSAANGSVASTVDEPGGVVAITTHTDDNDNVAIFLGPFEPADGGCVIEARFKIDDITQNAIFCGFSETLAVTTPVLPASFDTATLTIAGSGGVVGMLFDPDETDGDNWRAVAGDGGTAATGYAAGTSSGTSAVNDEYDVVRVEIDTDGSARCYLGIDGGSLKLIQSFTTPVTAGDVEHAVLMFENRTGSAQINEVDYFYAEGGRDWTN